MSDVLRQKALLLLKRERELLSMRQRLTRTSSWLALSERTAGLARGPDETALIRDWPQLFLQELQYQEAALARVEPDGLVLVSAAGSCVELVGKPSGVAPDFAFTGPGRCEDTTARPRGTPGTFAHFMWCPIVLDDENLLALVGYDERAARFRGATETDDFAYFRQASHQLQTLAGQLRSIARLSDLNDALRANDAALRTAREELLLSTRLAAVGAMAGRTAHEVLNPLTGIRGRVDLLASAEARSKPEFETFAAITTGWRKALAEGGVAGLVQELERRTPAGRTMAEDDLDALCALQQSFERAQQHRVTHVEVLGREVTRIAHTVDGLRGLSRPRKSVESLALEVLIAESVDVVSVALTQANVVLEVSGDVKAKVCVDRYEFIQVVTNLLRNAILAIEERGDGGRIHLVVQADDTRLSLFVEDDGVGISPEHVPLLFEQQFTTRDAARGTGLGLSIARGLARQSSGDLRLARSEPGRGSTFVLELPLGEGWAGGTHGHVAHR